MRADARLMGATDQMTVRTLSTLWHGGWSNHTSIPFVHIKHVRHTMGAKSARSNSAMYNVRAFKLRRMHLERDCAHMRYRAGLVPSYHPAARKRGYIPRICPASDRRASLDMSDFPAQVYALSAAARELRLTLLDNQAKVTWIDACSHTHLLEEWKALREVSVSASMRALFSESSPYLCRSTKECSMSRSRQRRNSQQR